jgi:hypothetical protein
MLIDAFNDMLARVQERDEALLSVRVDRTPDVRTESQPTRRLVHAGHWGNGHGSHAPAPGSVQPGEQRRQVHEAGRDQTDRRTAPPPRDGSHSL